MNLGAKKIISTYPKELHAFKVKLEERKVSKREEPSNAIRI